ncbi:hypothetical protein Taro_042587 [Colocasia esculenta]|uniref:Uncharacterized protein n=1 Tax=Colocasia esculenta TaxID=4460 RepID=A0A843WIT2_COLES|nr:hypothetical protein [Colocasia esculenta]
MRSGRSSRPRHLRVLYFPRRRLWIMKYSCKVWCKPCRRRLILRLHSRHSWRPRKELMYGGLHYCVPGLKTARLMLLGTSSVRWSNTLKRRRLRRRGL